MANRRSLVQGLQPDGSVDRSVEEEFVFAGKPKAVAATPDPAPAAESREGKGPKGNAVGRVPLTTLGVILLAIGGWNWVLWGIFLRTTLGLHATWLVNSATHMWGSRRFHTKDDSRNSWWVAAVTFGEGWHNNHHAYPASAAHGLAWYEIDITYLHIRALQLLGLATGVRRASVNDEYEAAA